MLLKRRHQITTGLVLAVTYLILLPAIGSAQVLLVSVRDRSGEPLSEEAIVRVSWQGGGQTIVETTGNLRNAISTASFQLGAGDFDIEVEAVGYTTGTEHVSIASNSSNMTAYVFLTPIDKSPGAKATTGVTLNPSVQRELDKSLIALRQNKFDEARKHLEKAKKMAPSSPDILYMMGILDYSAKDMPAARTQFEAVLSSYPMHKGSLLMLGQMQFDAKEYEDAATTLQKAVEADPNNWRAHYLLALAFVRAGDLPKAEVEAARAGQLNREKTASMMLLRAKILMVEGKDSEAQKAFQSVLKDFPKDEATSAEAKKYLEKIEESRKSAAANPAAELDTLKPPEGEYAMAVAAILERPWAPPDVDAAIPPTADGISCSAEDVIGKTEQRVARQLADLERFSATEKVEHQVIDATRTWTIPISREFEYLIFVHHNKEMPYYFVEDRRGGESPYSFPTAIATRGLVPLGFMIVQPVISKDFEFTCEGLGTWNGKPAWQIHFLQRQDVPSRVRSYSYNNKTYPVALKGRLWIGANDFNLVHLETALREPVPALRLNKEQLTIDYGPVHFESAKTELWLPWNGNMYFDLLGHRYHHKHALTNFMLFDIDTKSKTKAPAEPSEPKND